MLFSEHLFCTEFKVERLEIIQDDTFVVRSVCELCLNQTSEFNIVDFLVQGLGRGDQYISLPK